VLQVSVEADHAKPREREHLLARVREAAPGRDHGQVDRDRESGCNPPPESSNVSENDDEHR